MRQCAVCGTEFEPRHAGKAQLYCSRECYERNKANRRRLDQRLGVEKVCETCGESYRPFYAEQRFCTARCRGLWQRIDKRRRCEHCGAEFIYRKPTQRFCSRQCHYDSHIGQVVNAGGYLRVFVPRGTPGADSSGRMLEHRWVMQQAIGRPLEAHETVHHMNGDKLDNRIENLQLRNGRHGKGAILRCRCCGSDDIEAIEIT